MHNKTPESQAYNNHYPGFRDFKLLQSKKRFFLIGVIVLAIAMFFYRVPLRALQSSMDFKLLYVASVTLLNGSDPYNHELLNHFWIKAGGAIDQAPNRKYTASIYPITTYTLLFPFALFTWEHVKIIWFVINLLSLFSIYIIILTFLKIHPKDYRAIIILIPFLALAPVQNSIFQGQLLLLILLCLLLSIKASTTNHNIISGILLSIALCLKPQISLFLFLYYTLRGRWTLLLSSFLLCSAIIFIGVSKLGFNDFSWIINWKENLQAPLIAGGGMDPTALNLYRHHLLNLQYLLHTMIDSRKIVNVITFVIFSLELLLFINFLSKDNDRINILLDISTLFIISILPVYHRNYDATILIFPLILCFMLINTRFKIISIVAILLISPFFIPGPSLLFELSNADIIPSEITTSWYWNIFLMPHQVWCILILSIVLIYLMIIRKRYGVFIFRDAIAAC